jgi:hypothetical protein
MRCRSIVVVAGLLVVAAAGAEAAAPSRKSCHALWDERNSFYKEAGYCFKTEAAIRYFDNDGCTYTDEDDVPISEEAWTRISRIIRLERVYRCRWDRYMVVRKRS